VGGEQGVFAAAVSAAFGGPMLTSGVTLACRQVVMAAVVS